MAANNILMAAVDRIPPYLYEDADIAGAEFESECVGLFEEPGFERKTLDIGGTIGAIAVAGCGKLYYAFPDLATEPVR